MYEGFGPVVVDTLGSLCTSIERSDLPIGLSPHAENVTFFPGGVKSRDGFTSYLTASDPTIEGYFAVADYVSGRSRQNTIVLAGGAGSLRMREEGTVGSVPSVTLVDRLGNTISGSSYHLAMRTTTMYGRAFVAVSDGKRGICPPLQINQAVVDTIGASGGSEALITFGSGSMIGGRRYVAIAFETRSGFISGVVKLTYDTMSDYSNISITGIPLGPPSTVRRRIFISLADAFDLYNPPGCILDDNTSTTAGPYDLSEEEIASGLPMTQFLNLQQPTAHIGVERYGNRLVMWGGDGRIFSFFGPTGTGINPTYSSIGLINLDFSSNIASSYNWAVPGVYGEWYGASAAATVRAPDSATGELSNYLRIVSAGGASDGKVTQGVNPALRLNGDKLGRYYLNKDKTYGIRARLRKELGAIGTIKIDLYENNWAARTLLTSMSASLGGANVAVDTEWRMVEASGTVKTTGQPNVSIEVYASSVTPGKYVDISHIEIFDTEAKQNTSLVALSRVDDPESFDVVTGRIGVSIDDGQEVRNVFVLHGNLYVCKERSLYMTQDNGNEPASWNVELVSDTVGTPSVNGVGVGDNFVVIASRDGLYLMSGGMPEKISQEIQPTWDRFDWSRGEQIQCSVDTAQKVIIVTGPVDGDDIYQQLRMNYVGGFSDPIGGGENTRKWSTDRIYDANGNPAPPVGTAYITMDDRSSRLAYCLGIDESLVLTEEPGALNDYATYIASAYETAPIGDQMGRSMFGGVLMKVRGADGEQLLVSFVRPSGDYITLPSQTLTPDPMHDVEIRTHQTDTQLGVSINIKSPDNYFILKRLSVLAKPAPFARFRGYY